MLMPFHYVRRLLLGSANETAPPRFAAPVSGPIGRAYQTNIKNLVRARLYVAPLRSTTSAPKRGLKTPSPFGFPRLEWAFPSLQRPAFAGRNQGDAPLVILRQRHGLRHLAPVLADGHLMPVAPARCRAGLTLGGPCPQDPASGLSRPDTHAEEQRPSTRTQPALQPRAWSRCWIVG